MRQAVEVMKPFFSNQKQDWVVSEICECGHLQQDHGSLVKKIDQDNMVRLSEEGNCCKGFCSCKQYRFGGYITAKELFQIQKKNKKQTA